jgi:hypothetical protein
MLLRDFRVKLDSEVSWKASNGTHLAEEIPGMSGTQAAQEDIYCQRLVYIST